MSRLKTRTQYKTQWGSVWLAKFLFWRNSNITNEIRRFIWPMHGWHILFIALCFGMNTLFVAGMSLKASNVESFVKRKVKTFPNGYFKKVFEGIVAINPNILVIFGRLHRFGTTRQRLLLKVRLSGNLSTRLSDCGGSVQWLCNPWPQPVTL